MRLCIKRGLHVSMYWHFELFVNDYVNATECATGHVCFWEALVSLGSNAILVGSCVCLS